MSRSVVQIDYVNGRRTTDVVECPVDEVTDGLGSGHDWIIFPTRSDGHLIVRADEVAYIRIRPLRVGESLDTYADVQRAFREPEPTPVERIVGS